MRTNGEMWLAVVLAVVLTGLAHTTLRKNKVLIAMHNGVLISEVVEVWWWE